MTVEHATLSLDDGRLFGREATLSLDLPCSACSCPNCMGTGPAQHKWSLRPAANFPTKSWMHSMAQCFWTSALMLARLKITMVNRNQGRRDRLFSSPFSSPSSAASLFRQGRKSQGLSRSEPLQVEEIHRSAQSLGARAQTSDLNPGERRVFSIGRKSPSMSRSKQETMTLPPVLSLNA